MIVVGILLFALLVIVHELGHFWAARRAGVEVEEFGVGFPPRLLAKRFGKSKTLISLNLIPLGGFVKLKGEADDDRRKGSFGAARFSTKVKILVAGVAMNVLAAFVLIWLLAWIGLPKLIPNQFSITSDERARRQTILVADVLPGSAAASTGIEPGDRIKAIDGQSFNQAQQLTNYTQARPEQSVIITIERDGTDQTKAAKFARTNEGKGQLGVVPFEDVIVRYSWSAPLVAAVLTLQLLGLTVMGLVRLMGGLVSDGLASDAVDSTVGPVGVFALLQNTADLGVVYVLLLIITISISLAVINILPLPALDGGRLALISLFRLFKKPLNRKLESAIHAIGFALLLLLAIFISYFDVKRFF